MCAGLGCDTFEVVHQRHFCCCYVQFLVHDSLQNSLEQRLAVGKGRTGGVTQAPDMASKVSFSSR